MLQSWQGLWRLQELEALHCVEDENSQVPESQPPCPWLGPWELPLMHCLLEVQKPHWPEGDVVQLWHVLWLQQLTIIGHTEDLL